MSSTMPCLYNMLECRRFSWRVGCRTVGTISHIDLGRPLRPRCCSVDLQMITDNSKQVAPSATEQELKKAYKVNALKYHPGM